MAMSPIHCGGAAKAQSNTADVVVAIKSVRSRNWSGAGVMFILLRPWPSFLTPSDASSQKRSMPLVSTLRNVSKNVVLWNGRQWMAERLKAKPHPAVEVRIMLPDGTECKAVWSHLRQSDVAKLVTVHFFD